MMESDAPNPQPKPSADKPGLLLTATQAEPRVIRVSCGRDRLVLQMDDGSELGFRADLALCRRLSSMFLWSPGGSA